MPSWDLGARCVTLASSPAISGLGPSSSERKMLRNMIDKRDWNPGVVFPALPLQRWAPSRKALTPAGCRPAREGSEPIQGPVLEAYGGLAMWVGEKA